MILFDPESHLMAPAKLARRAAPFKDRIRFMSRCHVVMCLLLGGLLGGGTATAELPAFPGAEGSGALAVGGRGGAVCKVANLNDSGTGSLRACVEMEGPRTVIFRVGGTIELKHHLWIRNPYLTIAGQTAPGGGIQLRAAPGMERNLITVSTHDVIIRYLRLRRGFTGDKSSAISVTDTAEQSVHNVMFDHLSLFWSENQNWGTWARSTTRAPRNITLQNSVLAEMLSDRVNLLTGGTSGENAAASTNIDFHNNLLAHAQHRNPLLKHGSGRWINNLVYNWDTWASRTSGGVHADFVSNLWKPGPSQGTGTNAKIELVLVGWEGHDIDSRPNRDPWVYVAGNRGLATGMSPDDDNWRYVRRADGSDNATISGSAPPEWRRNNPLPATGVPIKVRHVDQLEEHLLPIVGASKRLDCSGNWAFNRDSADERVIEDYRRNRGSLIATERDVGGFPVLAAGEACKDTSGDGIPDDWAIANQLDPSDRSLGGRIHESGYTYLELYLSAMRVLATPSPRAPVIGNVE